MSGAGEEAASLRWLCDLADLRSLPQRYSRAADARDIDAMAELFHRDGTVEGSRGESSVADYLDAQRTSPRPFAASMHVLGEPLIDLEPGADRGRMDTYAVVYQFRAAGQDGDDLQLGVRYLDQVVRHGGGWVIERRRAEIVWTRPFGR